MKASETLQESIANQRRELVDMLEQPLKRWAAACAAVWGDRAGLVAVLQQALPTLSYCKYLYVLDPQGIQVTDNVSHDGKLEKDFGRDRSQRPYMPRADADSDFMLSQAYISLRARRPSFTAMQTIRAEGGELLGYLGADYDMRDLPLTRKLYEEPRYWRQIKGDPSIRGTVFYQTRHESEMDRHIETVMGVIDELMVDHGVFHVMLHFSSSRAIIWLHDDPYRYRLLGIEELMDPNICLAYPRRDYPAEAMLSAGQVRLVLERFQRLRMMDEMLYLRSGTLNIFNGVVGLTFSCDGSHYVPCDEFLAQDDAFWVGPTRS